MFDMLRKLLFPAFLILFQWSLSSAQRQWVLPTTTAAEMRNPYTWYWPYAIAGAEAYRDYFVNAQRISNQLYQQAYATQAFSWAQGQAGQVAGQAGQAGQAAWQTGQQAGGMVTGQGGQGWNGQGQGGQGWNDQGQGGQNWNG